MVGLITGLVNNYIIVSRVPAMENHRMGECYGLKVDIGV